MRVAVAAIVGTLSLLCAGIWATDATAAYVNACRNDPGPINGTITNDAAIEVHDMHRSLYHFCIAEMERLESIAASLNTADDPTTPATRVSLVKADRDRLTLAAFSGWALLGLTLCLLFSSKWHSSWRFLR